MSNGIRCRCARCTIRGLMGPALIITIGVLFLLHQMRDGAFDFGNTYPFILIVAGVILLASSLAPMEGHISSGTPLAPPAPSVPNTMPGPTQPPAAGQGR